MGPDPGDPKVAFKPESDFRVTLPADASSLFYLRLFAGAVGRPLLDPPRETWIDELKLLVTEGTSFAIEGEHEVLSVDFRVLANRLECRISPVLAFSPSDLKPDPYDMVMTLAEDVKLVDMTLVITVLVD